MEIYHGKLIELISIEKQDNHIYLHVRLSIDQEDLLFWEIDHETAENLRAATVFDDKYMYRLSLHSQGTAENQYKSYITKTYRESSENIYFSCSEEYSNRLSAIKSITESSKLDSLPFLMSTIHGNDSNGEIAERQNQEQLPLKHRTLTWLSVAIISAICITLFLYVGHSDLNKIVFAQKPTASTVSSKKGINLESKKEKVYPIVNIQTKAKRPIKKTPPTLNLKHNVSYSIPAGYVALSFDDGPSKYSKEIVNILKKYNVGGTFFYIGQNVKKYPESVRYTYTNGFVIGNHSMNHPDFTKLSYKRQKKELLETNRLITQITHKPVELFRPPYGAIDDNTKKLMKNNHYKVVLWNKDPRDWQNHDPIQILHYIKNSHPSGSIIILHENKAVVDALPSIIAYLKSQELKMVNLH